METSPAHIACTCFQPKNVPPHHTPGTRSPSTHAQVRGPFRICGRQCGMKRWPNHAPHPAVCRNLCSGSQSNHDPIDNGVACVFTLHQSPLFNASSHHQWKQQRWANVTCGTCKLAKHQSRFTASLSLCCAIKRHDLRGHNAVETLNAKVKVGMNDPRQSDLLPPQDGILQASRISLPIAEEFNKGLLP